MNKLIIKAVALITGTAFLTTVVWYSFDLMSSKSRLWWMGIVFTIIGVWLFTLFTNWILKLKNKNNDSV